MQARHDSKVAVDDIGAFTVTHLDIDTLSVAGIVSAALSVLHPLERVCGFFQSPLQILHPSLKLGDVGGAGVERCQRV